MNCSAVSVMEEFPDIVLSYGQSDEYSFVFRKETNIFNRRSAKLLTYVTSLFTASYVNNWSKYFSSKELKCLPYFDGRVVLYPSDENLRDYLSWRQADVHVNNLYNTAFWSLVLKAKLSPQDAEEKLRGTYASDKQELLFSEFGLNYNNLPEMFKKGTTLVRKKVKIPGTDSKRLVIVPLFVDIIRDTFWKIHSELLGKGKPSEHLLENETSIEIPELLLKQFKSSTVLQEKSKES